MTMFTQAVRRHRLSSTRRGAARILTGIVLFALVAPEVAAGPNLPAGTKVPLQFAQRLDSRHARKGDLVNLRVRQDVIVDGRTVIARGARATARVLDVRKPRPFGRKAQIKLDLVGVRAADGREVPLGQYNSGRRFTDPKAQGAAAGGLILLGPIGLAAGAFVKGNHLVINPGTAIDGTVRNDTTVNVGGR
jgi:hypothetical protein